MTDEDFAAADALLDVRVKEMCAGVYGCIVTDGATFRDHKAVVVLFDSPALTEPVVLATIVPDAGVGVAPSSDSEPESSDEEDADELKRIAIYTAKKCAPDIIHSMRKAGIAKDHVTNVNGDNNVFNDALCDELGIERTRCIPHTCGLMAKQPVLSLPLMKDLLIAGSTIIRAGGTNKRTEELRAMDLAGPREAAVQRKPVREERHDEPLSAQELLQCATLDTGESLTRCCGRQAR
jgi:hypothetical protein